MFNFLYVYATSLYVTPSEVVKKIEISSVKARTDAEGNKVMDVTIRNRGNVHQILIDAALTVKGSSGTVTLTGNEQLPGIDSINVLARKTITTPSTTRFSHRKPSHLQGSPCFLGKQTIADTPLLQSTFRSFPPKTHCHSFSQHPLSN